MGAQPAHRVEQLRAELPPPLEGAGTGRKTHGRWFVGDRPAQTLISGEDDTARLAAGYLARVGAQRASIRAHAEIKLAALIRQRWEATGLTAHATIVINNLLCSGSTSCPVFLPWLLPPGCSLTVITPTERHTFTGDPT
ncbi:DddA-like double-stranded DNA deaminase toxin [Actinokineospora sp. 24-640]